MSSLSSWLWGTTQIDEAVDKATSELLPTDSEDIALNLEICDQIRSKAVSAKDAMRALKRRLNHKNPNVQLLALGLTDICIKNGGDHFIAEVSSREFMDNLVSILKIPALNSDVKTKILRLIQNWALAFEGKPAFGYFTQVYKTLQQDGFTFPPRDLAVVSSAMVDTQTAPEWIDSDVCLRCRTPFTFTNRKHHCRNCGQVFDQQCSSKTLPLPHFGITQEVRVCDNCYPKLRKEKDKPHRSHSHRHSSSVHSSRHRAARELQDAELQRAIQLSLEEAGLAQPGGRRPGYVPYQPDSWQSSEPPLVDRTTHPSRAAEDDDDPDLKAAIEASLREASAPRPSAPIETPRSEEPAYAYGNGPTISQSYPPSTIPAPAVSKLPNYDLEPLESDAIMTFSQTVEQVQSQGNRDIYRYPAVGELYDRANGLRPKLAMNLDDTGRKEQLLNEMHDKLSQAVKLYDHLLTEQLSRPHRQTPHHASTLPPQSTYGQPTPVAPNGYNQWASPQAQSATLSPQGQTIRNTSGPYSPQEYLSQQASISHPQVYAPPTQYAPQSQPSAYQPVAGPSYAPYTPQVTSPPPLQYISSPPPVSIPQHQTSAPADPYSAVPSHNPIPISTPAPSSEPLPQSAVASTPAQPQPFSNQQSYAYNSYTPAATPTPQSLATHAQLPPSASNLTRHASVMNPPSAASSRQTYLGRSNTVAHAPPSHRQQQGMQTATPSQALAGPPSAPQAQLPSFPVAPTLPPQSYPGYGPSIPTSPPVEREALLIDL